MEQIDYFDAHFNYIGQTSIDEIHQKGLWHQTFACWLYHPQKRVIYLQLRGSKNRVGANTFDASGSGHLSAGEKKEDGFRELAEELGVFIEAKEAYYLGYYLNVVHLPNYTNNEFCHIYIVSTQKNLDDFVLQKGEVSNIFALNVADTDKLLKGQQVEITSKNEQRIITVQNMCAYQDRIQNGYYKRVFDNIQERI